MGSEGSDEIYTETNDFAKEHGNWCEEMNIVCGINDVSRVKNDKTGMTDYFQKLEETFDPSESVPLMENAYESATLNDMPQQVALVEYDFTSPYGYEHKRKVKEEGTSEITVYENPPSFGQLMDDFSNVSVEQAPVTEYNCTEECQYELQEEKYEGQSEVKFYQNPTGNQCPEGEDACEDLAENIFSEIGL